MDPIDPSNPPGPVQLIPTEAERALAILRVFERDLFEVWQIAAEQAEVCLDATDLRFFEGLIYEAGCWSRYRFQLEMIIRGRRA